LLAVNLADDGVTLYAGSGRILIGTEPARVGEKLSGSLELNPWEAVIAELR